MNWNIDDVPIFISVMEHHGISDAARALKMPKSTISRTLSRLEDDLGIRLFDRNTRQFRLTDEGRHFAPHAYAIMEQAQSAQEAISGLRETPSGILKVALPMALSREVIGGKLAEFSNHYPSITLQVTVAPYAVNLFREDLDMAFMVGPIADSELSAQLIYDSPLIWVASHDYAKTHHLSDKLADLRPHLRFCEQRYQTDRLAVKTPSGRQYLDTSGLMSVNDPIMLRDILLKGGGIGLLPQLYCQHHLNSGALNQLYETLLPEPRATIYAVTVTKRLRPAKADLFTKFVKDCVASYASHNLSE